MKKKIINGMLMAAFLFAGTTSFVSCKDNVDDELVPVWQQLQGQSTRLTKLEGDLESLKGTVLQNSNDITNLKTGVSTLQTKVQQLESWKTVAQGDIERLDGQIDSLENAFNDLKKYIASLTFSINVNKTWDPVIGTFNNGLMDANTLCAFVGKNLEKASVFPMLDDVLTKDYIASDFEAEELDSIISATSGNAGKIYFTINPLEADASVLKFSLVNSVGYEALAKIGEAEPSNEIITLGTGKFASPRIGVLDTSKPGTYLYEAPVTIAKEDLEAALFDVGMNATFNGLSNWTWSEMGSRIKYMVNKIKQHTAASSAEAIQDAFTIFKEFYLAINNKRYDLVQYGLQAQFNDGTTTRTIVSPYDITCVSINPFGLTLAHRLDGAGVHWNLQGLKPAVAKIVQAFQNKVQGALNLPVTVNISNQTVTITGTCTIPGQPAGTITATGTLDTGDASLADGKLNDQITQLINNMLAPITAAHSGAGLVDMVEAKLNNVTTTYINTYANGALAAYLVDPIIYVGTDKGAVELLPAAQINLGNDELDIVMTSQTGEWLVPFYKKFIAVYDKKAKTVENYVFDGSEKIATLTLPQNDCEIIYQVMDFCGKTITKKYSITRK